MLEVLMRVFRGTWGAGYIGFKQSPKQTGLSVVAHFVFGSDFLKIENAVQCSSLLPNVLVQGR